jgi:hypothetical protein
LNIFLNYNSLFKAIIPGSGICNSKLLYKINVVTLVIIPIIYIKTSLFPKYIITIAPNHLTVAK